MTLPKISYSKLDLLKKCPYRYKKKYIEKKFVKTDSVATEFGSIVHKGLELKGQYIMNGQDIDYDEIHSVLLSGFEEKTDKGHEKLLGVQELRRKYFEEWYKKDETTNQSVEDRFKTYIYEVLPNRMEDIEWNVYGTEVPFEFVYDNRCIIIGFIDRVDVKYGIVEKENYENSKIEETENGLKGTFHGIPIEAFRIVDYKSSKKVFRQEEIKTPLQMVVYDLACLFMYGIVPQYHEYDFVGLNQKQAQINGVCSNGYLKRGVKKINSFLDQIDEMAKTNDYAPGPSPLCHWCEYCATNQNALDDFKNLCPYFSLWTPENKTFQVNQKYISGVIPEKQEKRKFIF